MRPIDDNGIYGTHFWGSQHRRDVMLIWSTLTPLKNIYPLFYHHCHYYNDSFSIFWCSENHQITPLTQGGAEDIVRLLITKTLYVPYVAPVTRNAVSRMKHKVAVMLLI